MISMKAWTPKATRELSMGITLLSPTRVVCHPIGSFNTRLLWVSVT
jgi:hypothetical protein